MIVAARIDRSCHVRCDMSHMKKINDKKIRKYSPPYLGEIAESPRNKSAQLNFASARPTKLQSAERAFVDEPVRTAMAKVTAPAY